jgi:hypothetical protein
VAWLRTTVTWILRPYRRHDRVAPDAPAPPEYEHWNQLVGQGWVERWHPTHRYRRREWLWVRRTEDEFPVFPGSRDGPRLGSDSHYRLNGDLVYRAFGHPEGPSSVPWFAIRNGLVYPGEGYPEGPGATPRYRKDPSLARRGPSPATGYPSEYWAIGASLGNSNR